MLQDSFGRQFEYLRLSITDVCNFKCNYCLPNGYDCNGQRDFLSISEIETLVAAFAKMGTKKIRITGGEPGLRKDLADIIAICKRTPNIESVALTTNGFNLAKNIDQWADAGLTNLNVSLDSLNPHMFKSITGHHRFNDILDGINRAKEKPNLTVKLNAVLLKQFNQMQLGSYLNWIKQNAVTIRFIELMETGDNAAFFSENHVSGESIKSTLLSQGWQPVIRHKLAGPAQEFYHADYVGKIGLIMPYSKDFCKSCNRLRVSSNGNLHLCLFAEQGISLRNTLVTGDVSATCQTLVKALATKTVSHELHARLTGSTTNLAMLGG